MKTVGLNDSFYEEQEEQISIFCLYWSDWETQLCCKRKIQRKERREKSWITGSRRFARPSIEIVSSLPDFEGNRSISIWPAQRNRRTKAKIWLNGHMSCTRVPDYYCRDQAEEYCVQCNACRNSLHNANSYTRKKDLIKRPLSQWTHFALSWIEG